MIVNSPILMLEAVTKTYAVSAGIFGQRKLLQALRGIDLSINDGEILGIVGESGCGKSTLARLLLGLEKPTSGQIMLRGQPIGDTSRGDLTRRIQPVFQDPYSSLNPRKTIASIITLPLRVHRIGDKAEQRRRVAETMERVGLPARLANVYPNQLSGGQRQRVAIARALIMRPQIVICDEPTSALDVSVQSQILNLLRELHRELRLTFVIISHNLAVIQHLATRVGVMYLGRLVEEGQTEPFFGRPLHPYGKALLGSVLTPDPDMDVPDLGLGTAFPNAMYPPVGCGFHPRCARRFDRCDKVMPTALVQGGRRVECHLYDPMSAPA